MGLRQGERRAFGAVMTPAFPKRGPDAGTTDQVRSQTCRMAQTTRTLDWPTYPLQTPSGGGLAPTPNRSTTPAEGVLVAGEGLTNTLTSLVAREGLTKPLTNPGPLQKRMFALLPQLSNAKCLIFLESRLDFRENVGTDNFLFFHYLWLPITDSHVGLTGTGFGGGHVPASGPRGGGR